MFDTFTLLDLDITTAVSATALAGNNSLYAMQGLAIEANFTYGSGGTTAKAYVQTSLDGGSNWIDVACLAFTTASARKVVNLNGKTAVASFTPADGALADNTEKDGVLGDRLRVKYVTTGTYGGDTNLKVSVTPKP